MNQRMKRKCMLEQCKCKKTFDPMESGALKEICLTCDKNDKDAYNKKRKDRRKDKASGSTVDLEKIAKYYEKDS